MKTIGYLLLCIGFVVAAYATALDVVNVNWGLFAGAAAAAIAGVFVFKQHEKALARSDEVLENNRNELRQSIEGIVTGLESIAANGGLRGAELRDRIDNDLRPHLTRFAEARESMVHLFGLQTYADIMSHFAAGERYVNRVWSSSADGYDKEASTYIGKASEQFADARRQLTEAGARLETRFLRRQAGLARLQLAIRCFCSSSTSSFMRKSLSSFQPRYIGSVRSLTSRCPSVG